MEFIQFHPTCLYHPKAKSFLISEAVRGEGGVLKTIAGVDFMDRYHPLKSLAPRDIVARAIDSEMKQSGADHVLLDITHKPARFIIDRFPNIYQTCLRYGIDITKEPIPVVPAAHYQCGGVLTTVDGETDIGGLYAVGEVACTGLHGANRLASNSLLEGLVFGARAGRAILGDDLPPPPQGPLVGDPGTALAIDETAADAALESLKRVMWDGAGIVRDGTGLRRAIDAILRLERGLALRPVSRRGVEARNLLFVGRLIAESALGRRESRGAHFRQDFPVRESGRGRHSIIAPGAPAPDLPLITVPDVD